MTNVERFFDLQNHFLEQERRSLNHPFPYAIPKTTVRASFDSIERLGSDTVECELAIYFNNILAVSIRRKVPKTYKFVELQEELMGEALLKCLIAGLSYGAEQTLKAQAENEQTLIANYHINPYCIMPSGGLRNELLLIEGKLPDDYQE